MPGGLVQSAHQPILDCGMLGLSAGQLLSRESNGRLLWLHDLPWRRLLGTTQLSGRHVLWRQCFCLHQLSDRHVFADTQRNLGVDLSHLPRRLLLPDTRNAHRLPGWIVLGDAQRHLGIDMPHVSRRLILFGQRKWHDRLPDRDVLADDQCNVGGHVSHVPAWLLLSDDGNTDGVSGWFVFECV